MSKRILLIEPYYGGSHKQFLDGMTRHIPADFKLLTLPARKWKMRMQLAAPWFVQKIRDMRREERDFYAVLCSSFIDVGVFKALVSSVGGWNDTCLYLTYFHENQFSYPDNLPRRAIHPFTAINFTSALVSDRIAFNSEFNRTSFIEHCRTYVSKAVDMELDNDMLCLVEKSSVLYPGLDYSGLDEIRSEDVQKQSPLVIWNHRWEHDKNPEEFFSALYQLQEKDISFKVAVLGQNFMNHPDCFQAARVRLQDHLLAFGYVEAKKDYYEILKKGAVVVSTAHHEFFGISILEAVRAGCIPVLPDRLSYPELFDKKFLYPDGKLYEHLETAILGFRKLSGPEAIEITERFSWHSLFDAYKIWLGIAN